jgi:TonB family protein
MEPSVQQPAPATAEPHLLLDLDRALPSRWARIGGASVAIHVLLGAGGLYLSKVLPDPPRRIANIQIIRPQPPLREPLLEPLTKMTQRAPNRNKLSDEFNLASLPPRQERSSVSQPGAAAPPKQAANKFVPPSTRNVTVAPSPLPEAPAIDTGQLRAAVPPPQGLGSPVAPPPPQIVPEEKPKLVLETPGRPKGAAAQQGLGRIPVPRATVDEALRQVVRGQGSRGLVVGDDDVGAASPSARMVPIPGKMGSSVELLSDPMGVDFWPYLVRVLSSVRRNWFAVIPESARLGQRGGRVIIQFAIDRNGSVPKLVIANSSGTDALDRAAVAAISASNPFPPLPPEFRGSQVRLQFAFRYNVGTR